LNNTGEFGDYYGASYNNQEEFMNQQQQYYDQYCNTGNGNGKASAAVAPNKKSCKELKKILTDLENTGYGGNISNNQHQPATVSAATGSQYSKNDNKGHSNDAANQQLQRQQQQQQYAANTGTTNSYTGNGYNSNGNSNKLKSAHHEARIPIIINTVQRDSSGTGHTQQQQQQYANNNGLARQVSFAPFDC
jgi:hypothetical protein